MPTRPLFFGPLLYFRTVPALDRLSSALLGAIAQHAEEVFFPAGSALLEPEQPREAFFVIVEGKVSVRDPSGRKEILGPGDALGFLHLLARSEEGLSARAVWDTVALRVDWDAHLDACERHFPILEVHMSFLAQRCLEEKLRLRASGPLPPGAPREETGRLSWRSSEEDFDDLLSPAPQNLVRRLLALHRSAAFPSASMDALAELSRHLEEIHHQPGSEYWQPGDPSEFFLLVSSGQLTLEGPKGEWLEVFGPGETVGRLDALAGLPRGGVLRVHDKTVTLRVELDPLMDILEDHFTMAIEFTAGLARELMDLQNLDPLPPSRDEIL